MILEFIEFINRWLEGPEARVKRAELERVVEDFLLDTAPLVPAAPKYPEAALYRYAWKRAVVLERIYQERSDKNRALLYRQIQEQVAEAYYAVAPDGPYGKVRLQMGHNAVAKMRDAELARLELLTCVKCRTPADFTNTAELRSPVDCPRCGARYTSGVYILSNAAMPRLVKIGHTTKSLRKRVVQLNTSTGVPGPFKLEAWFLCAPLLAKRHEKTIHRHFEANRVPSKEFFEVDAADAVRVAEQVVGRAPEFRRELSVRTKSRRTKS